MGNHQGDDLAQRQPLLGQGGILIASGIQQAIHLIHIGTKPDPETIPQAVHLAIARGSGERYRVEIGPGHQFACFQGFWPQSIGTHAG
ncbi:hypothetical protein D3C75_1100910 [compost metagenome]